MSDDNSEETDSAIVVAVDGSPESDAAVRFGTREATMRGVSLVLLNIVSRYITSRSIGPAALEPAYSEWQQEHARDALAHAGNAVHAGLGDAPAPDIRTEVVYSAVVPALAEASKRAGMVVVGCRGHGAFGRLTLGSTSSGLIHHGHGPIALVRADQVQSADLLAPVLLGVDGSAASEAATALAFDEASRRGVDLIVLHAWSDLSYSPYAIADQSVEAHGHEILAERLAGWQERYPDVTVHRDIVADRPGHWLVDRSQQAQLLVVGSHGRGGYTGMLLGSVSTAVAHGAHCPVIVVRPR